MCELCVKNKKLTEDKAIIIETMEATTPELGPVGFCSPKSSSFSGSASIVVEEAARNFQSPRPSINKSGAPNFFVQHDKVEDSKLRRYLETCGRALEQFLQRQTSSNDSVAIAEKIITFLMDKKSIAKHEVKVRSRIQRAPTPSSLVLRS